MATRNVPDTQSISNWPCRWRTTSDRTEWRCTLRRMGCWRSWVWGLQVVWSVARGWGVELGVGRWAFTTVRATATRNVLDTQSISNGPCCWTHDQGLGWQYWCVCQCYCTWRNRGCGLIGHRTNIGLGVGHGWSVVNGALQLLCWAVNPGCCMHVATFNDCMQGRLFLACTLKDWLWQVVGMDILEAGWKWVCIFGNGWEGRWEERIWSINEKLMNQWFKTCLKFKLTHANIMPS